MATNIKITALSDITSANMTYNDLVAVVDMDGTPETKKANVQIVGNLILSGAGGSYFAKAAQATNAETVSNAAQPAITSVGNLTTLTVTGNVVAGNVSGTAGAFTTVTGDGSGLTNLPSGSNSAAIANGTSNINIPAVDGNINTSVAGNANILIVTGTGVNVAGTLNVTGNAVVGNISATNLGNVSAVNLDGNALNILHGDGSWSADATSYGNSNVVTLMGAFGSNTITTTGVITGDGSGLSAIAGANVSGAVALATSATSANAVAGANVSGAVALATSATSANAVAYANVSGTPTLGNISTINIDGNVSNVLRGDGTFAADADTAYGDSNVVTLMGAFGSNTISTTGLITGDGGGLSNVSLATFAGTANAVAYANVSGTPTLGNISTINIDGNVANVLRGDGTFSADANSSYGDSNVTSLLGAFGSNTITTTGAVTVGSVTLINNAKIKDTAGDAVSFGVNAGMISQGNFSVAIGYLAGEDTQGIRAVAIGQYAGDTSQGADAVAIGSQAGEGSQGVYAVGIGYKAGEQSQSQNAVAIGYEAGEITQGDSAVAIGYEAGQTNQGVQAVAIGVQAGKTSQGNNSIIINATNAALNQTTANTFTVAPVRNDTSNVAEVMFYNTTSNEITYGNTINVSGNISAGNVNSNVNGFSIGYLEIPQVSLTADDTIALEDSGKHFYSNTAGNITLTIPTNATVAFPIGTAISIVEEAAGNILVNAAAGVNLYLAGNATAANRVLATYGMATLMKVGTDTWFINGSGVA